MWYVCLELGNSLLTAKIYTRPWNLTSWATPCWQDICETTVEMLESIFYWRSLDGCGTYQLTEIYFHPLMFEDFLPSHWLPIRVMGRFYCRVALVARDVPLPGCCDCLYCGWHQSLGFGIVNFASSALLRTSSDLHVRDRQQHWQISSRVFHS